MFILFEAPHMLLDRLNIWPHVQRVIGNIPQDSGDVRGLSCEDILVVLEEVEVHAFLFVAECHPNLHHLGWIL